MNKHAYVTESDQGGKAAFELDYKSFGDIQSVLSLKSGHVSGFSSCLAQSLPEVAAQMDEYDFGSLHLEVGVLTLATRNAIARRDWYSVGKYFHFAAGLMKNGGHELVDALTVSYVESLLYGETTLNYMKARSLLPESLAAALAGVERHYQALQAH